MVSGCVSSVIVGWDLTKCKVDFRIENKGQKDYLNTINTLNYQHDSQVFLSGTRDGYIKIYDPRNGITPAIEVIFEIILRVFPIVYSTFLEAEFRTIWRK